MNYVFYTIGLLVLFWVYRSGKNNSGEMRCKSIVGLVLDHYFLTFHSTRICRLCGLVQQEGAAGLLMSDGETWYDKGYAENKDELIKYYQNKNEEDSETSSMWKQRRYNKILTTKFYIKNGELVLKESKPEVGG